MFPFISNMQFNKSMGKEIEDFQTKDVVEQVTKVEEMDKENKKINEEGTFYTEDPFAEGGVEVGKANMIGVLTIPQIDEKLTVYDKTDNISLREGVGLLDGTNYPTGREGDATVLTGHDGMVDATIFRNLNKLEVGDRYTFDNGKEVLTYEVYKSITVLPHETDVIEQIPNQNTMVLLTCETPEMLKGINTHRLVVYSKRVPTKGAVEVEKKVLSSNLRYTMFGVAGVAVLSVALFRGFYYKDI